MKVGTLVTDPYGNFGVILEVYSSWNALVEHNNFLTGSPEEWLDVQLLSYSQEELDQPWFLILHPSGGSSWFGINKLHKVDDLELLPPVEVQSSDLYPLILKDQSMKTYYFSPYEFVGTAVETDFSLN